MKNLNLHKNRVNNIMNPHIPITCLHYQQFIIFKKSVSLLVFIFCLSSMFLYFAIPRHHVISVPSFLNTNLNLALACLKPLNVPPKPPDQVSTPSPAPTNPGFTAAWSTSSYVSHTQATEPLLLKLPSPLCLQPLRLWISLPGVSSLSHPFPPLCT